MQQRVRGRGLRAVAVVGVVVVVALCASVCSGGTAEEWKQRSIYQVLTDRFAGPSDGDTCGNINDYCGGTWAGLTSKLDYITGMGFDAIWISPIVVNTAGGYHGYWTKSLDGVNPHFGTSSELAAFVDAAHARGVWVMVDIVLNHVGPVGTDFSQITPFSTAASYHPTCAVTEYTCFTEEVLHCRLETLPDLNQGNTTVADELVDWASSIVAKYGFDGIRADTVMYINQDFWARVQAAVGVYIVGEVYSDVSCCVAYQEHGVDATLSYPMFFTLRSVFQDGQSMNLIQGQEQAYKAFPDSTVLGTFIDNQDNPRFLYQNTDKVPQYLNALTYVLMAQGVPIVYYGTEQYFDGGPDPANREPLWPSGYKTSTDMYAFLGKLNQLRKLYSVWNAPQTQRYSDNTFYAFSRGSLLIALTNSLDSFDVTITYTPYAPNTKICNILASPPSSNCLTTDNAGHFTISMGEGYPKIFAPQQQ